MVVPNLRIERTGSEPQLPKAWHAKATHYLQPTWSKVSRQPHLQRGETTQDYVFPCLFEYLRVPINGVVCVEIEAHSHGEAAQRRALFEQAQKLNRRGEVEVQRELL